jgi:hypothetical protein
MFTVFYTRKNGKMDFVKCENEEAVKEFYLTLSNKNTIRLIQDEVGNTIEIKGVSIRWPFFAVKNRARPQKFYHTSTKKSSTFLEKITQIVVPKIVQSDYYSSVGFGGKIYL